MVAPSRIDADKGRILAHGVSLARPSSTRSAAAEVGEVITVLETEKSSYDLEASHSGILHVITDASDEKIPIGELIGVIAESDQEYDKARSM